MKERGRREDAAEEGVHCERSSMAESEHPVAELQSPGRASRSLLTIDELLSLSKSSEGKALSLGQVQLKERQSCMETSNESISKDISALSLTWEDDSSSQLVCHEPGEQVTGRNSQNSKNTDRLYEYCSVPKACTQPPHTTEAQSSAAVSPHFTKNELQGIQPASLSVQKSKTDSSHNVGQDFKPQACGKNRDKVVEGQHLLTCKKLKPAHQNIEEKDQCHPQCENTIFCGSYIHPSFEDTFAAYCHPQPISAPCYFSPGLAGTETCSLQHATATSSPTNHLTTPRLMSSVSETGLDAKHQLHCCNLGCSWISTFNPGVASPQPQMHTGGEERSCSLLSQFGITTRNMGTMTTHTELRDVGVQTRHFVEPLHVFPQICLAEQGQSTAADSDGRLDARPKSPVKEVKWDAEGMTWEVYGASVDPEELGLAIQRHLELQIKETAMRAAKLSRQNTNISRQSSSTECNRKRNRMISSVRITACCAGTTTAVD